MEGPQLWALAHLLIQAEPWEGQKQHQTKPGPTNQRRSGDVGPEVALHASLPLTLSRREVLSS